MGKKGIQRGQSCIFIGKHTLISEANKTLTLVNLRCEYMGICLPLYFLFEIFNNVCYCVLNSTVHTYLCVTVHSYVLCTCVCVCVYKTWTDSHQNVNTGPQFFI